MLDEIIRKYIAAYNERDIDTMLTHVTEDVVFENISIPASQCAWKARR